MSSFNWYILVTSGISLLWVVQVFWRMGHPHRCSCGYTSWFVGSFKKHVLRKHGWV